MEKKKKKKRERGRVAGDDEAELGGGRKRDIAPPYSTPTQNSPHGTI